MKINRSIYFWGDLCVRTLAMSGKVTVHAMPKSKK